MKFIDYKEVVLVDSFRKQLEERQHRIECLFKDAQDKEAGSSKEEVSKLRTTQLELRGAVQEILWVLSILKLEDDSIKIRR